MLFGFFSEFIKLHPQFFLVNLMLMCLVPINEVFMSKLYGRLFDAIQKNIFTVNHFYVILATIVFLQFGFAFSDFFNSKQMTAFQEYCKKKLLKIVFEKFEKNKEEPKPHDVLNKILRTQHILADWYGKIFGYLIPVIFQIFITIYFFFTIDLRLSVYILLLVLVFSTFLFNTTSMCNENSDKMDIMLTKVHDEMGDILVNYVSVHKEQSLCNEMNLLSNLYQKYRMYHNKTIQCTIKYRLMLSVTIIFFVSLFVQRCYHMLKQKQIKNEVFYSVFMILANCISNIVYMIDVHRDMIFDWGLIKNSGFEVPVKDIKYVTHRCVHPPANETAVLDIVNLSFKYKAKTHYTLQNINLSIMSKERVAITGHIGSGKTTLMKIILKMIYPTSGSVYLQNQCIYDIGTRNYFKKVGFMPQNCMLFKRSIIENIMYDNRDISEQDVQNIVDTYDLRKHFRNGMHISSDSLSGGQRQLVWFLRIYFKNPTLIILDEPTASLDKETKDLFIHLMKSLLKDKTIITITHDPYILEHMTRVINIKDLMSEN